MIRNTYKYLILLGLSFQVYGGQVTEQYTDLVYKTYKEALVRAENLDLSIKNFVNNPGVVTHEMAKSAWKVARSPYGQSEVFRFYNGPIDRDGGPEGLLNSWPLDEAYIDYVVGASNAGIINNLKEYPVLSKSLLVGLNELDGEKNISTGYHAIEFLLWGQDLYVDGPGQRSFEDYVEGKAPNAKRRGQYLLIASEILLDDLQYLVDAWAPNKKNYRAEFESYPEKDAVKKMLTGAIFMAGDELSGERMYVAYDTRGQEDEHSCFSDMTHMDIQWNFWGVENVLLKTGLIDLIRAKDSAIADDLIQKTAKIKATIATIPAPFDQAIQHDGARAIIFSAITQMEELATEMANASALLGARVDY